MGEVKCLSRGNNRKDKKKLGNYSSTKTAIMTEKRNLGTKVQGQRQRSTDRAVELIDDLCELQSKNKNTIATSAYHTRLQIYK